jgi:hypothetical protein
MRFLSEYSADERTLPTLKLYRLYDYFVEAAGMSIPSRPQSQRWVEIQGRISDAKHLDPDASLVLKTIGILNLISSSGSLRATCALVTLAMCDNPLDQHEKIHWEKVIETLLNRGFVTWRKKLDELRIWEGSDFDVEQAISAQTGTLNLSLADLLTEYCPLRPLVAHRHSYQTGTLRYFERQYFDSSRGIEYASCKNRDSDGLICYWVDEKKKLERVPAQTEDGKPVIVVCANDLQTLQAACFEYVALKKIEATASQLQSDGVARREVRHRLILAKRLLDESLAVCRRENSRFH